jgi:hypothetical protein
LGKTDNHSSFFKYSTVRYEYPHNSYMCVNVQQRFEPHCTIQWRVVDVSKAHVHSLRLWLRKQNVASHEICERSVLEVLERFYCVIVSETQNTRRYNRRFTPE